MSSNYFWDNIPDECKRAISELKRLKVYTCLALDYEYTFADVWWLVLHEVDMYSEGEFCREAKRSYYGIGEPDAMNLTQAKRADAWLIKYLPLFNKYKGSDYYPEDSGRDFSEDEFFYGGQL